MSPFGPEVELHVRMGDGTPIVVRQMTPEDRPLLVKGLQELSRESRLSRFFSPFPHLSDRQLDYLTAVDQDSHVAWGAILENDQMAGVGIGRFMRLADEPETAEIAVTVLDRFQHKGVGTLLFAVLYRIAGRLGVKQFRAYVLLSNTSLVHNLKALGAKMRSHEDGVIEVDLPILETPAGEGDTEEIAAFKSALDEVDAAIARLAV